MIVWSGELLPPDRIVSCLQSLTEAALNDESQLVVIFGCTLQGKQGTDMWCRFIVQLRSRGVRVIACPGARDYVRHARLVVPAAAAATVPGKSSKSGAFLGLNTAAKSSSTPSTTLQLSRTVRREGKRRLGDFMHRYVYAQTEVVAFYPPFSYLAVVERDVFLVLKSFHHIGGDCVTDKQIDWARAHLLELSREIDLPHCRLHLVMYGSIFPERSGNNSGGGGGAGGMAGSSSSSGGGSSIGSGGAGALNTAHTIPLLKHRRRIEERLLSPFRFYSVIHRQHSFLFDSSALTPKLAVEIRRVGIPSGGALWMSWSIPQSPILIADSPKKPDPAHWEQTAVKNPADCAGSSDTSYRDSRLHAASRHDIDEDLTTEPVVSELPNSIGDIFEPTAAPLPPPQPPPATADSQLPSDKLATDNQLPLPGKLATDNQLPLPDKLATDNQLALPDNRTVDSQLPDCHLPAPQPPTDSQLPSTDNPPLFLSLPPPPPPPSPSPPLPPPPSAPSPPPPLPSMLASEAPLDEPAPTVHQSAAPDPHPWVTAVPLAARR